MHDRALPAHRFFSVLLTLAALIGCATTPAKLISELSPVVAVQQERPIFVSLPVNGILGADQRRDYNGGAVVGERAVWRCAGKWDANRMCDDSVSVKVRAVEGSIRIDPNNPQRRPQLIGWIVNTSPRETSEGFRPIGLARYALVVDSVKQPEGHIRTFIVRINRLGLGANVEEHGKLIQCHRPGTTAPKSDFYFAPLTCDRHASHEGMLGPRVSTASHEHAQARQVLVTSLLTSWALPRSDDPSWFTCTGGCCTSDQIQTFHIN